MIDFYIPIVLGSAREGRHSEKAARYVLGQARADGRFETELFDVKDFLRAPSTERPAAGERADQWREAMARADGLIIVSPEYNHGYPGELKLMLDQLYREYNRKPIGICGVAGGNLGGARAVEALRLVAIELQMAPIRSAVYFANVRTLFDEQGVIKDATYRDRLTVFFDELVWYAQALKAARR